MITSILKIKISYLVCSRVGCIVGYWNDKLNKIFWNIFYDDLCRKEEFDIHIVFEVRLSNIFFPDLIQFGQMWAILNPSDKSRLWFENPDVQNFGWSAGISIWTIAVPLFLHRFHLILFFALPTLPTLLAVFHSLQPHSYKIYLPITKQALLNAIFASLITFMTFILKTLSQAIE